MEKLNKIVWEFSIEHIRSKSEFMPKSDLKELSKITEEEEWTSIESKSIAPAPSVQKRKFMQKHCRIYNEPPKLSDDPLVSYFQQFLIKLQKHLKIYECFIDAGVTSNLLRSIKIRPAAYYYKHIHFSNNDKFKHVIKYPSITYPQNRNEYFQQSSESLYTETSSEFSIYPEHTPPKILEFLALNRQSSFQTDKKTTQSSRKINKRKITQKRVVLDRTSQKLVNNFQEMCNGTNTSLKACRLTNFLFKQHLQKKFPCEIVDSISKYFDFKSSNFEDFCTEVDRLLVASEERLLSMCFDAFDINKDRYICYQDSYVLIENRKEDIYDYDLVKLKNMFEMKKKGTFPLKRNASRKGRRMSLMSIASEMTNYEENIKKKEVPHIHPSKPEALTFEDFSRIEFKGKPQLIYHLFAYICNYDINKCQEIVPPIVKSRRQSEEIILEFSQKPDNSEYLKDERYPYYEELENSIALFSFAFANQLLQKFEVLRDKSSNDPKIISKGSMVENWPKLFGNCSEYVSSRFYAFFSGPRNLDVTKSRFLQMISSVTEDELSIKQFSFNIYDARNDGKITSDEIINMQNNLPEHSLIWKECQIITDEIIAGIFEKKRNPVKHIDFGFFNDLIKISLFYQEFTRVINTPIQDLLMLPNSSWEIPE